MAESEGGRMVHHGRRTVGAPAPVAGLEPTGATTQTNSTGVVSNASFPGTQLPPAAPHSGFSMRNLTLAFRTLRKTPFVTVIAIVSLALGIGANAAIYSLFDEMLLRPLPVQEPQRLVNL